MLMPWNLVNPGENNLYEESFSKFWFWGTIVAIVVGNLKSHTRWLLGISLAYFLYWFYSVQVLRYLQPMLPFIALAITYSIDTLISWIPVINYTRKSAILAVFLTLLIAVPGIAAAWKTIEACGELPVTSEERFEYLVKKRPFRYLPLYTTLNERHGSDYTIYSFNDRGMVYYCDGILMGDFFGDARYSNILYRDETGDHFRDSETLYKVLRQELHADYMLLNRESIKVQIPTDEFFTSHFIPIATVTAEEDIYTDMDTVLFEIRD